MYHLYKIDESGKRVGVKPHSKPKPEKTEKKQRGKRK